MTNILPALRDATIAVWFSAGVPSAMAAHYTLQLYGQHNRVRILNNHIVEEDPDNLRFLADCQEWFGVQIEQVVNPKYPHQSAEKLWDERGAMSFPRGAPCTFHLKKEARQIWERNNHVDWHVLGFAADEADRHNSFVRTERSNVLPVLIAYRMTKRACFEDFARTGIEIPAGYRRGYPNANCYGCVKSSSPAYWNHVRKDAPEVFARRAEQSRRLGARLVRVNNERIFLDELDPAAKGRPLTRFDVPECGLFCEESPARATPALENAE